MSVEQSELEAAALERLILKTDDDRFSCFGVDGSRGDKRLLDEFKGFVKRKNERYGYEGFSFKVDEYFDPSSTCFYTRDRKGEIVATSRATLRGSDNILPFEMGLRTSGGKYSVDEPVNVGDINSFAMTWGRSGMEGLMVLYASLGEFMQNHDVKKVFCLLDEDNQVIVNLYTTAGFVPSPEYDEKIHFPTYGKTRDGVFVPTQWRVMEMGPEQISMYADMAKQMRKPS